VEPYDAPGGRNPGEASKLNRKYRALPVVRRLVLQLDKAWFESKSLPRRKSLVDLTKPISRAARW
jgi:hypothetical protein